MKRILYSVLCITVALLISGCGTIEPESKPQETDNTIRKTESTISATLQNTTILKERKTQIVTSFVNDKVIKKYVTEKSNKQVKNSQAITSSEKKHTTLQEKTITGISINNLPKKTQYYINDQLVTNGLTVKVQYSNGSCDVISGGFSVSKLSSATAGIKSISVLYKGYKCSFNVTVKEKDKIRLLDLTYIEEDGHYEQYERIKDNIGNEYFEVVGISIYFANDAYRVFYNNGKYNKLTGRLIVSEAQKDEEDSDMSRFWPYMQVFVDDELVYTSPYIKRGTMPVDFSIDISGSYKVKVIYHNCNRENGVSYLVDTYFKK